ncbi:RNA methyltransferase [Lithospermum erythrorhizon]|uniref:RNA methyltransferase n=1 Tax=Lithospermum erythrorhizon TaxID=34254 RepID=A0AAV3PRP7_LITER
MAAKSAAPPPPGDDKRRKKAERSAYFSRREAAKILRTVLQGDARRRAIGSIKSLVYSPQVRNKKATYALVCQTLKYLPILKDVMEAANVPNGKWKKQIELMYMITYDILLGQEASLAGDAEKYLLLKKDVLQSALAKLLASKGVKHINGLMDLHNISDIPKPRYVRVNTLKVDADSAYFELKKNYEVRKDDVVPDLFILPPGTDLHKHPYVINGSLIMQGKASSMVAVALAPEPGWEVLDACAAPGNKTIHLAALMKGKGRVIACELDEKRFERLKETVRLAGACNVQPMQGDFLALNPEDPSFSKVRAILLDPSCSGSGTAVDRLDHLLPSHGTGGSATAGEMSRLRKLAAFQKKVLEHAFSFPAVERIVYSTCSIKQTENEDVIKCVWPIAESYGFELATALPTWSRRGLPVIDGSEHLLRTDLVEDKEGFFIALFVRKGNHRVSISSQGDAVLCEEKFYRKRKHTSYVPMILSHRLLFSHCGSRKFRRQGEHADE